LKVIREVSKEELKEHLYNINLTDSKIYEEVNTYNALGIFQMNGGSASNLMKRIKPNNFEELNAVNAFARPGTIDFAEQYIINRETGKSNYPPLVNEVLKETNSVILFQEQLMKIFNVVGGFSLEETNEVRSLMKKLGKLDKKPEDVKKWDKVVEKFKKGAIANNITEVDAKNVAEDLLKMSSYSFNRCFSGDCKIDRDNSKGRFSPTIEEMFKVKNDKEWSKKNGHKSLTEKYNYKG